MGGLAIGVLVLFAAVYTALAVVAWRRPLLARLAIREGARRPGQSALLVAGLMIGGAAMLSGQVFIDSVTGSSGAAAERAWGRVDITVGAGGTFFGADVANALARNPHVAGAQAGVELPGSVADLDSELSKSTVMVVGFDPASQRAFGAYRLQEGRATYGQDLVGGNVLISRSLADPLQARVGNRISVVVGSRQANYRVAGVTEPEGPGAYGLRPSIFAPVNALEPLIGATEINVVRVAARGDSHAAAASLREDLQGIPAARGLQVREAKAVDVANSAALRETGRPFWTVLGLFIAVVGSVFVVNLVLALAEERRPRLAILRALGLSRSGVVATFMLEGGLYGLGAAAVGIGPGFALAAVMLAMTHAAGDVGVATGIPIDYRFEIRPLTVLSAIAAGTMITLVTLLLTAWRGSAMSISTALRRLPDPVVAGRHRGLRRAALALIGLTGLAAMFGGTAARLTGGIVLIAVAAVLAQGWAPDRLRATVTGFALSGWVLIAGKAGFSLDIITSPEGSAVLFVTLTGVVFGIAMVVAANLRLLEGAAERIGTGRLQAILRPPVANTARRPISAGLATGAFALAVAMLTLVSIASASFEPDYQKASGGFDVVVSAAATSTAALPPSVQSQIARQTVILTRTYVGPEMMAPTAAQASGWLQRQFSLYELTADQLNDPPLQLTMRNPRFGTDLEAWRAVREDSGWVITSSTTTPPPDWIRMVSPSGEVELKIAGGLVPGVIRGVMGSRRTLAPFASLAAGTTIFAKAAPGVTPTQLALDIRRAHFAEGAEAATSRELVDQGQASGREFAGYIALLMRVGLVLGTLGLALIGLRAVIERRRDIGVTRALGYQPSAVVGMVLVENLLTATAGIVCGLGIGVIVGPIVVMNLRLPELTIDWEPMAVTVAALYAAVLLVSVIPAFQASRLKPAEALRLLA